MKKKIQGTGGHKHEGHKHEKGGLMKYIIGFILSVVLTLIAFVFVMMGWMQDWSIGSKVVFLLGLAFIQMVVQIYFFLHLNEGPDAKANVITMWIASVCVLIIIVGTWLTMQQLNYNMMGGSGRIVRPPVTNSEIEPAPSNGGSALSDPAIADPAIADPAIADPAIEENKTIDPEEATEQEDTNPEESLPAVSDTDQEPASSSSPSSTVEEISSESEDSTEIQDLISTDSEDNPAAQQEGSVFETEEIFLETDEEPENDQVKDQNIPEDRGLQGADSEDSKSGDATPDVQKADPVKEEDLHKHGQTVHENP